jgi:CO/xanthine dehydrogenase FAD-binding subunit
VVAIGLTLFPQRFISAEKFLQNKNINEKNINIFLEKIVNEVKINNDIRVSIDYKKEILCVLIKEFLLKLK